MNLLPFKNKLLSMRHLLFKLRRKLNFGLAFTSEDPEYKKYKIGKYTYGAPEIFPFGLNNKLEIGKFCSIADKVKIFLGGNHSINSPTTYVLRYLFEDNLEESLSKGDVIIGNDVWIGYGALILSGVKIGDGAVISTNSVVYNNVKPYSIVGGNPAKFWIYRFEEEKIEFEESSIEIDFEVAKKLSDSSSESEIEAKMKRERKISSESEFEVEFKSERQFSINFFKSLKDICRGSIE
jgi:acetyltransferase-like isoleucine patch superfamily enzyme